MENTMFTVLFTIIGVIVFIASLIKGGFKSAFLRLLICVGTGFTLDVLMGIFAFGVLAALA